MVLPERVTVTVIDIPGVTSVGGDRQERLQVSSHCKSCINECCNPNSKHPI